MQARPCWFLTILMQKIIKLHSLIRSHFDILIEKVSVINTIKSVKNIQADFLMRLGIKHRATDLYLTHVFNP